MYTREWLEFYSQHTDICDIIHQSVYTASNNRVISTSANEISENIGFPAQFINTMLKIQEENHCTFFAKYGRVLYDTHTECWVFIPKSHKLAMIAVDATVDNIPHSPPRHILPNLIRTAR